MNPAQGKTALITGASVGIGMELARIHAAHGGNLIVVARRDEKLHELKKELEEKHQITVTVIPKDLSVPGAAEELYQEVQARNLQVDFLINNAGFGGRGFFHESDWDRDKAMINLNILALTALTRLFVNDMVARKSGKIVNVASMAGFLPGPLQAIYYATKAYVLSFSEAIANELAGTGVTVTALCPGATNTEFARVADLENVRVFKNTASAESVAREGYRAMLRGTVVNVTGLLNKFTIHFLLRLCPRGLLRRISRATMEK